MTILRSIKASDFQNMCDQQEKEKSDRLAAGSQECTSCKSTGTYHGERSVTVFGCRSCGGIGAMPINNQIEGGES